MKKITHLIPIFTLLFLFEARSQDYIIPKPVTWSELQLLQLDSLKTSDELGLSENCPQSFDELDDMKVQSTYFKEILWTHYFWTSLSAANGRTCIVKHGTLDFAGDKSTGDFEILNNLQSRILLSAAESQGFKEKGILNLARNINLHNQAISEKPYLKYGGRAAMIQFLEKNPPEYPEEIIERNYIDSEGKSVHSVQPFIEYFESRYSDETLSNFSESTQVSQQMFDLKFDYSFDNHKDFLTLNVSKKSPNSEAGEKTHITRGPTLTQVPDGQIAIQNGGDYDPQPTYSSIGRLSAFHGCNLQKPLVQGTDFLITSYVSLTAAHNIICADGTRLNSTFSQPGVISNAFDGLAPWGSFDADNVIESSNYSPGIPLFELAQYDYGVLRSLQPFVSVPPMALQVDTKANDVRVVGYPISTGWMHEGTNKSEFDPSLFLGSNVLVYDIDTEKGMSGGPILADTNISIQNTYAKGVHNTGFTDPGTTNKKGAGVLFTPLIGAEITSWFWSPTGQMQIDSPANNVTVNLVVVPALRALFNPFNRVDINGNIEISNKNVDQYIEWSSDIDGPIGTGAEISPNVLKTVLSEGAHYITAKLDAQGEEGEKTIRVFIEVPEGGFTSDDFCILDLASGSNTCSVNVGWQVTNSPETPVVWNETDNTQFASGNTGSQSISVTTNGTELKLYPSNERIILLDTTNIEAKVPTGDLSIPNNVCSLEPSPFAPDGSLRDAKATPPGCGVELTWTNVQWSSPSIFYRIGNGSWQHLYQIPCNLEGEVCSDSINTNELIQELVPVTGAEFKLLQYNDANSGELSAPVGATGYRFADAYEFDDGTFPNNSSADRNPLITTQAIIGVPQHNHNFHERAFGVFEPNAVTPDVDSIQIDADTYNNQTVLVQVFNMASGLDVGFDVQCVGMKTIETGAKNPEPEFGMFAFVNPISITPVSTGNPNERIVKFTVQNTDSGTESGNSVDLSCDQNRILINRTAGTPSENLTYSVVVNLENGNAPVINDAYTVCTNNYCPRLLGSNFPADAWVSVRENTPGSSELVQYSGNLIYVRTPFNGQDRLQFPMPEPSVQAKFRSPGLCFKVMSSAGSSNEMCLSRPATVDQLPLLGSTVVSHATGQDLQFDTFSTKITPPQLKIWGNSWKEITYNYNITPNTVLEFEFNSNKQEPEVNGIGLVKVGQSGMPSSQFWQVFGTQSYGNQEYNDYVNGSGFKLYRIPIGQFMSGSVQKMVFLADEDVRVGQNTIYRNMGLVEDSTVAMPLIEVVGTICNYVSYDCVKILGDRFPSDAYVSIRENVTGSAELVQYSGNSIYERTPENSQERLQFPIVDPNVQAKFQSPGLCFKVVASIGTSNEVCRTGPAIPSQNYLLGSAVEQYRPGIEDLHYYAHDVAGGSTQPTIEFWGNSWKQINYNYTVTADTVLEFEFQSVRQESRINGIGFLKSGQTIVPSNQFWQVSGTGTYGQQGHNNYLNDAQYRLYRIPIGQYFTGPITKMVFAADDDARIGHHIRFKNMKLSENPFIDEYDDVPAQRPYDDDIAGGAVRWLGSDTEHLHNFHEALDNDWTMVQVSGPTRFSTELVGANADTSMFVYEWTSWQDNPSGDGTFVNIVSQLKASDVRAGASEIIVSPSTLTTYGILMKPRLSGYGEDSEYKFKVESLPPASPDQYDNVPSQRAYDDDVRERAVSWLGSDTVHNHNFHDLGDEDWTLVYVPAGVVQFKTQLIGANSDTRLYVYKWISAAPHPSDDGTYINVVDEFVAQDTSVAASEVTVTATEPTFYAG